MLLLPGVGGKTRARENRNLFPLLSNIRENGKGTLEAGAELQEVASGAQLGEQLVSSRGYATFGV